MSHANLLNDERVNNDKVDKNRGIRPQDRIMHRTYANRLTAGVCWIAVNLTVVQLFPQSRLLIRLIGVQLARGPELARMNYSPTHACVPGVLRRAAEIYGRRLA